MAQLNFEELRESWGKPITIESGVTAPQSAPLPKSIGPEMQSVYKDTQAKALAMTLVTRRNIADSFRTIASQLFTTASARVGPQGNFYITDCDGKNLFLGNTKHTHILQTLAADHVYEELASRALDIPAHPREHLLAMADITIPRNGVVFETGAGADWPRIKALEYLAKERGSQLICHDLLPSITHQAAKEAPNVPYIAMPPLPELLSACLEPMRGRPLTISLKNTISSMGFGAMWNLFALAKQTNAEQVIATQSLGFSTNASVFPEGLRPMSERVSGMLIQMLLNTQRVNPELAIVALQQAHLTLTSVMFEIVHYYLRTFAQEAGLPYSDVYTTTDTTTISDKDNKDFLNGLHFSQAKALWQAGEFNNLVFSPFGAHKSTQPDVKNRELKITTNQLHLRFGRKPGPALTHARKLEATELLSPRNALLADLIDSTDLILPIHNVAKTQRILRDKKTREEIRALQKLGINMALQLTFTVYPQSIPYVKHLPATEKERIIAWYKSAL